MSSADHGVLVFVLAVNAIALVVVVFGFLMRSARRRRAQSWTLVQGHIETHDIRPLSDFQRTSAMVVALGYSYRYQGELYSGLHSLGGASSMEDGDTMCQQFPIGMEVSIRVNPDKPDESILDTNSGNTAQSATQLG